MITGTTRIVLQLADPVAHVRAPTMINAAFEERGVDAVMVPLHVPPAALEDTLKAVRGMPNVAGLGVTMPHKAAVLPLLDVVTAPARLIGAVNFIRRTADGRLIGTNLDGSGFVAGLARDGLPVAGVDVLLVGAGGVGRAIAFALAEAGARRLTIANRDADRAARLAEAVGAAFSGVSVEAGPADPRGFGMVVNATSLGMDGGDPLPVDPALLAPEAVVAEVIMVPAMTPLLAAARTRGCTIQTGRRMLEEQISAAVAFMTDVEDDAFAVLL